MSLWLPHTGAICCEAPPAHPGLALFVDRDGVIVVDAHYLRDPAEVRLLPGAAAALRRARAAGYLILGVSNQSGIGRGLYTEADFAAVQRRIDAELAAEGAWLDALYYCPHAPEAGCRCRKPAPGLLAEAAVRFAWRTEGSYLVGDKLTDVELARAAGLRAVLVRTGHGARAAGGLPTETRVLLAADLAEAVAQIVEGTVP